MSTNKTIQLAKEVIDHIIEKREIFYGALLKIFTGKKVAECLRLTKEEQISILREHLEQPIPIEKLATIYNRFVNHSYKYDNKEELLALFEPYLPLIKEYKNTVNESAHITELPPTIPVKTIVPSNNTISNEPVLENNPPPVIPSNPSEKLPKPMGRNKAAALPKNPILGVLFKEEIYNTSRCSPNKKENEIEEEEGEDTETVEEFGKEIEQETDKQYPIIGITENDKYKLKRCTYTESRPHSCDKVLEELLLLKNNIESITNFVNTLFNVLDMLTKTIKEFSEATKNELLVIKEQNDRLWKAQQELKPNSFNEERIIESLEQFKNNIISALGSIELGIDSLLDKDQT